MLAMAIWRDRNLCKMVWSRHGWDRKFPTTCSAQFSKVHFFSVPFRSCTIPVGFSLFRLKMDEITGVEWLNEAQWLYLIWLLFKQKKSFMYCLTPKKSHISIVWYQEISFSIPFNTVYYMKYHAFLQIKCDYHLKSENSLKRDDMRNIIQPHLSQI